MLADFDRHILTEMVILMERQRKAVAEFKQQWEIITSVRVQTELIVLGDKNANHPELPKMRDNIVRAMKIGNTKLTVIDDCMSRQAALIKHMVTDIKETDTRKGTETYA